MDEKTRANAAGAIGNLVRNSGQLSSRMASLGIVEKLMTIFINDQDVTTQVKINMKCLLCGC